MGQYCSCDCDPDYVDKQTVGDGPLITHTGRGSPTDREGDYGSSSDSDENSFKTDGEPSDSQTTMSNSRASGLLSVAEKEKVIQGFQAAVQNGNDSLCMYFVEEYPGLDLLHMDFKGGDTCMHVAVRNKSYQLVIYFINHDISPDAFNSMNGETALHTAVRIRDLKAVALLCNFGADVNAANKQFETPITIAQDNHDDDIIELLAPDTQQIIRDNTLQTGNKAKSDDDDDDVTRLDSHIMLNDDLDDVLDGDDVVGVAPLKPRNSWRKQLADIDKDSAVVALVNHQQNGDVRDVNEFVPTPISQRLDDDEKFRMSVYKVARTNPFSKLKRDNTKKTLQQIHEIAGAKSNLPLLEAWLEKKQVTMPYNWQKRWVKVTESYILWSDVQRDIVNSKSAKERKKWNNDINIMTIAEVKAVTTGKTQRKFIITTQSAKKRRDYLWKAATKQDRDFWVLGLRRYVAHFKDVVQYLNQ
mmetsp:Transcript_39687/g.64956  ORF Transcript_39687/g.64956 Transcript_39687/m.64956 type:complete len:471 (+) Transcript_39687:556-1968(+)